MWPDPCRKASFKQTNKVKPPQQIAEAQTNVRSFYKRTEDRASHATSSTPSAKSRHPVARNRLPLYPQERTFAGPRLTSAFDPKETCGR